MERGQYPLSRKERTQKGEREANIKDGSKARLTSRCRGRQGRQSAKKSSQPKSSQKSDQSPVEGVSGHNKLDTEQSETVSNEAYQPPPCPLQLPVLRRKLWWRGFLTQPDRAYQSSCGMYCPRQFAPSVSFQPIATSAGQQLSAGLNGG